MILIIIWLFCQFNSWPYPGQFKKQYHPTIPDLRRSEFNVQKFQTHPI